MNSLCGSVKIQQLSQRLRSINSELEEEINPQELKRKMEQLEHRFDSKSRLFEKKIILFDESAKGIVENIRVEKASKDLLSKHIIKKIKLCKNKTENDLMVLSQDTLEFEEKITKVLCEKTQPIQAKMIKSAEINKKTSEMFTESLKGSLSSLKNVISREANSRKQASENILRKFESECNNFDNVLKVNSTGREKRYKEMQKELVNFQNDLCEDIESERALRRKTKDMVLSVIEYLCKKVENNSKNLISE